MDPSRRCQSQFTLTFVIEILGIDVFHDCNEGWLDLGLGPTQGLKIQYQLSPGQNFDVDILIWPHAAKIWCGINSGWVRTWHFLQKRWLAFSIDHAFPVRVMDFREHVATVSPYMGLGSISTNAKNDKNTEVYLPKLSFGERRQFAPVLESEETLIQFLHKLIWSLVVSHIPASYLDGPFDVPHPVTDKRFQDSVLQHVQENILNRQLIKETELSSVPEVQTKTKTDMKGKDLKDKKKPNIEIVKFEIKLSGDAIIAGTGRIISFETVGDKPQDLGEIIVLLSSTSLPAPDDYPVVFVNIGKLMDAPIEELKKRKITHVYAKWTLNDEEHRTEPKDLNLYNSDIDFKDHHSLPLPWDTAAETLAIFIHNNYQIELRGIRSQPSANEKPCFFGYVKGDRDFSKTAPPKLPNHSTDVIIATTKINTKTLKSVNSMVRGEYPLYPPKVTVKSLDREGICTNDINAVRMPLHPEIAIPAGIILEAQMTLEVSIGVVGCKSHKMSQKYSRLYCVIKNSDAAMTILRNISEINEEVVVTGTREDLLTGFALDTGDTVLLFVEGAVDGQILYIWEVTEDYYPEIKPIFSTSAKYHKRIYPELLLAAIPFTILKMRVPLSVLLACPPIYTRPALPLPTRSAVLKIGQLLASKLLTSPNTYEMPTMDELQSFRLELCVAPRPPPVVMPTLEYFNAPNNGSSSKAQITQKINWEKKDSQKSN